MASEIRVNTIQSRSGLGTVTLNDTGLVVDTGLKVSGVTTISRLHVDNVNSTGVVTATTFIGALTGTATTATNVTLASGSATSNYVVFSQTATGNQPLKTDTGLTYNASTNILGASISGTATTATNVNLTAGSATSNYVVFSQTATGNQPLKTDTGLTYNASTNVLGATVSGSAASWTTGRTISLTGAVTGTSGAFNGTANLSFATTLASGVVSAANLDGAQSGSAPIYGARAWVNFDGTGSVGAQTVRDSGNITSVSKTATGTYTVTIATNIQDANYAVSGEASQTTTSSDNYLTAANFAAGSFTAYATNGPGSTEDSAIVCCVVHR